MASIERQTTTFSCAILRLRHVSVNGFQLIASCGATPAVYGMRRLASQPATAMTIAGDRAEQDRHERPHFDEPVAADEFGKTQMLRKDRVLDRTEQRRIDAEQRQCDEQQ